MTLTHVPTSIQFPPQRAESIRGQGSSPEGRFDCEDSMKSLAERFWPKVDRREPSECWLWTGRSIVPPGYGHISRGHRGEGWIRSHRAAWELTYGSIPPGKCVCHRCDVKLCCNPAHLFLGTITENNADCHSKGRSSGGSLPGETNPNCKLSAADIADIKRRYGRGDVFQYELAQEYDVTQAHISAIITGKTWRSS